MTAPRVFIALAALSLSSVPTTAQPLADVALETENLRESSSQSPRIYTNSDLSRFQRVSDTERPSPAVSGEVASDKSSDPSCEVEENHDNTSGNHFTIARCSDGATITFGSNSRTGSQWRWTVFPDGSQVGIDSCGDRWTYDARTTVYENTNGERRVGEGALRTRMGSAHCVIEPDLRVEEPAPSVAPAAAQPPSADGFPIWAATPGVETPTKEKRSGPDWDLIGRSRTGGAVYQCGDRRADPNRCLENGSPRSPDSAR